MRSSKEAQNAHEGEARKRQRALSLPDQFRRLRPSGDRTKDALKKQSSGTPVEVEQPPPHWPIVTCGERNRHSSLNLHQSMNFKSASFLALLCTGSITALASTHVGISFRIGVPAPIVVREAPPRRVVETVVASPGPGFVWVAGHYTWDNGRWVWVSGAWVNPPQPSTVWVEGHWDASSQSWTEGHWEVARPATAVVAVTPPPPSPLAGEIIVQTAPPPLRFEHRGPRPGHEYVWLNGYWVFRDGHHVWIAGHWDRPPHGRRVWVEPRWERHGGSYVFIEGRWR